MLIVLDEMVLSARVRWLAAGYVVVAWTSLEAWMVNSHLSVGS